METTDTTTTPAPTPAEGNQVGFGDKRVELSTFDRYKGTAGRTDRLAILSKTLLRGWRYYHQQSKSSFIAPTKPEVLKAVKAALGEPEQRFALIVFHYTTNEQGELVDPERISGKVKLWSISENRYAELSNLAAQWPLLQSGLHDPQVDLLFACKDDKFQRGTFTPTPTAHWKTKEPAFHVLMEKAAKAREKLLSTIGRQLSDTEILEKIGVASAGQSTGSTANAGDIDLGDILDA